jgi:hypothetical protein
MYLIDANVFIQAKNLYYRFSSFPGFWEWLDIEQQNNRIASVKPIQDELEKGNDELAQWAKDRSDKNWFLPVADEPTQRSFIEIANWVIAQSFKNTAQQEFLGGADPWLISSARNLGATVVTHEKYDAKCMRKILIPNVCKAFDVNYMDVYDLINILGARFGLR